MRSSASNACPMSRLSLWQSSSDIPLPHQQTPVPAIVLCVAELQLNQFKALRLKQGLNYLHNTLTYLTVHVV